MGRASEHEKNHALYKRSFETGMRVLHSCTDKKLSYQRQPRGRYSEGEVVWDLGGGGIVGTKTDCIQIFV